MSRETSLVSADWVAENINNPKVVIVEVDEEDRSLPALARAGDDGVVQAVLQELAVRQARQRVEEGQVLDPGLGSLALRDVGERADVVRDRARGVDEARPRRRACRP